MEGAQRDVLARLGCALAQWAPAPEQNAVSHGLRCMVPNVGFALDPRQIVRGSGVLRGTRKDPFQSTTIDMFLKAQR